jgi:hypothetical protein
MLFYLINRYVSIIYGTKMTPNITENPLTKYFRQPAIYIKLPSRGRWWPDNAINIPVNGELPIYPMTTKDEIVLKTPDALMNGAGLVDVMQSCCPNITDAWQMPNIDMDAILIAIRIASYGHSMDFDSTCPHCKHENRHAKDLRDSLAAVRCPDFDTPIRMDDLSIKLRPTRYYEANQSKQINFEEQKILQAIENSNLSEEEKTSQVSNSMRRLIDIGLNALVMATESIAINNDVSVSNKEHIREFYSNTENSVVKTIQERLADISRQAGLDPVEVACESCTKGYKVPIEFDYASFFGNGS